MRRLLTAAGISAMLLLCSCSLIKNDSPGIEESETGGIFVSKEFTEDDLFVQDFLNETYEYVQKYEWLRTPDTTYLSTRFDFIQLEQSFDERAENPYCVLPWDYPQTKPKLQEELEQYFTAEGVRYFLDRTAICKTVGQKVGDDGILRSVVVAEGGEFDENGHLAHEPDFIELDGYLYRTENGGPPELSGIWSTVHVTERTDDKIVFTYIEDDHGTLIESTGVLKYEDGWKYSRVGNCWRE